MTSRLNPRCALLLVLALAALPVRSQVPDERIRQGVDLMKVACGTSVSSTRIDISADARGAITLRRLPGATAGGAFTYSKEEANGLASALTKESTSGTAQLSAKQIDCMKSYADRIFDALFPRSVPVGRQGASKVETTAPKSGQSDESGQRSSRQGLAKAPGSTGLGGTKHTLEIPADVANLWVFYQRRGKNVQNRPDRGCHSPQGPNPRIEVTEAVLRIDEFVDYAKANDTHLIFVAESRTRGYVGAAEDMRFDGRKLRSNTTFWCEGQERKGYEVPIG